MGVIGKYKRVLIKVSGEALTDKGNFGISRDILNYVAKELMEASKLCREIGIVLGGGNIFRGISDSAKVMERVQADNMGMLATIINSLALQDALERKGLPTRVMSAINVPQVAEPYIRRRACRHLAKGRLVIFAAGTGNPYFSTDTAAVLRAREIGAQLILKATKVDGIYSSDPLKNVDAVKLEKVTYEEVLIKHLKIMDSTAISLAGDNGMSLLVFNLLKSGNICRVLEGHLVGSRVEA